MTAIADHIYTGKATFSGASTRTKGHQKSNSIFDTILNMVSFPTPETYSAPKRPDLPKGSVTPIF